ncbi:Na+/H+ antiporter NhaC [Bacillus shivajii]|uniref:Na+/H+ antiporter NhaC n=1 Tax=Bacillus shivajii TaxID=1983719 RepID=UPI001CF94213|nr:Na+/H+ antiporter NhaC [Bacillus shivajii]UCZ51439.1 Na+/H+ antiporter NhaC [Bacillus shivajii]
MQGSVSSLKAMSLLILSAIIIFGGVIFIQAPTTIVLISAGIVVIALSLLWGIKWEKIENDLMDTLKTMFPAILILLSVGMLIGVWIASGTVPLMVYYGLQLLSPSVFLVVAALACAIMSIMAGTSWGTIGTVGVALMGVSIGLDIPLHYTAGAVVVGAIFGDKMSPLSDTTVLASAVSDVNIVDHIKYMLWTTIPGFLISLVLFFIIGLQFRGQSVAGEELQLILTTLEGNFNLNPLLLLPPFIVLFLIFKKKPTLPVFAVGIILGVILAIGFQGRGLLEIAIALNDGFSQSTGVEIVDEMLLRGGLTSMLGTTALLIAAAIFGAPLKSAGVIQVMLNMILKLAQKGRSVMVSTFTIHGVLFSITGSYYVTYSVIGPMMTSVYDKYGLHKKNLSRTLEDTGTSFAPVIPWSVTGAFIAGTLGVPTLEYIIYAPMTYLALVFGLIYILTGFKIAKAENTTDIKYDKNKALS